MPVAADAEQLDVDAAGAFDRRFVLAAVFVDAIEEREPIGNVNVLRRDVDELEQVFVHPAVIALQPIGSQPEYSSRLKVTTLEKSSPSS